MKQNALFDMMESDAENSVELDELRRVTQKGDTDALIASLFPTTPSANLDYSKMPIYPTTGTPRRHQLRAWAEAGLKDGHCYFVDPGGGKTFIAIGEASHLYKEGEITGVLVIAPNGTHIQWIDEQFPEWCSIDYRAGHNMFSPAKLRDWMKGLGGFRLDVFAINYDSLSTANGKRLVDAFIKANPKFMLIVDESHYAKSHTSLRSKEVLSCALRSTYRRLLTGTPLLVGLEDLWTQYEACKPGLAWPSWPIALRKGKVDTYGFIGFRTHFCVTWSPEGNERAVIISGYRNQGELLNRVAPYVTRILVDEFAVTEKPDIIKVATPMSAEQARAYGEMKTLLRAQIGTEIVTAQNALVQLGRLLQIAAGFSYRQDVNEDEGYARGVEWDVLGQNKIEAAFNLIDQLKERVIVWAPFRAQQQMILDAFAARAEKARKLQRGVYAYGGADGEKQLAAWKEDPEGVLIGNQGSGLGVGRNLQMCAANIYVSNTFSAGARWQSIKRTDRMGQERQVRIWDLVTPGTVDERVMESLRKKEDLSRANIDVLSKLL